MPDLVLADGEMFGTGTAHVEVRNDGDLPIQGRPTLRVFSESSDLGSFAGEAFALEPGESVNVQVPYGAVDLVSGGIHGYDVELYLDAVDPETNSAIAIGPYTSHFWAGTADQLALCSQQQVSQPLGGIINAGERREVAFVPDGNTARMRVLLLQAPDADLDLHLYDAAGNHVGLVTETGETESQIPAADYSGALANVESIWLDVPAGETYRLAVEANDAPLDTRFVVTVLEEPAYPALLAVPLPVIGEVTNERAVALSVGALEVGGQRDVANPAVVLGDLTDGQGHVVSGATATVETETTVISAGGVGEWIVSLDLPGDLPDGTYTGVVTISGQDAVTGDPVSAQMGVQVALDTQAPAAPTLDPIQSPITEAPFTVTGMGPDPDFLYEVRMDGETLTYLVFVDEDGSFEAPIDVPAGEHLITVVAKDEVGNESNPSNGVTVTSTVDLTPPVTTVAVTGTLSPTGVYVSDVTIELAAEDEAGGSGLDAVRYSVNGVDWTEYTQPIAFTETGEHTLWFMSVDQAGNEEVAQVLHADVDQSSPTIAAWHSAAEHGYGLGELLLEIPDDGSFSEPRLTGLKMLVLEFSEAIDPATFTPEAVEVYGLAAPFGDESVDLSAVTVETSTREGDTVGVIAFSQKLPNNARYLVRVEGVTDTAGNALTGDTYRILTALAGDVTGDLWTNNTDVGCMKALRRLDPVDPAYVGLVRADLTCDGLTNNTDLGCLYMVRGPDARFIPDPTPPEPPPSGYGASSASMPCTAATLMAELSAPAATPRGTAEDPTVGGESAGPAPAPEPTAAASAAATLGQDASWQPVGVVGSPVLRVEPPVLDDPPDADSDTVPDLDQEDLLAALPCLAL